MNKGRTDLIIQAYNKLDKNQDGQITIQDLKGVYDVRKHPKYLNGEWSEDQILKKFLDTFDTKGAEDGVVIIQKNKLNSLSLFFLNISTIYYR